MRIISGCRRGHKLYEFEGKDVRPTTDRVKEAAFNLIQMYVPGARVLDMFAGSGALSFEALSRGARSAVLIDRDRRSVDIIKKNAEALRFGGLCTIVNGSCFDYLKRYSGEKFDIVFMDPPYNMGLIEPALEAAAESGALSENGIIVLESDSTDFRDEFSGLEIIKQRRYGRTYITVYSRAGEEK